MKRPLLFIVFVAAVAAGAMVPGTAFAEQADSVNLGIGGVVQTMPHCRALIYIAEYEHMIDPKISLLGRVSEVHYRFNDGSYMEDGRPKGVDIGARYYPGGNMEGLFISGTVGYWTTDWTFTHNAYMPNEYVGKGKNDSLRVNLDIGARLPIGSSSFSIMPALTVGKFFASSSCEYTAPEYLVGAACSQKSEVDYYMFLAVTAGIRF